MSEEGKPGPARVKIIDWDWGASTPRQAAVEKALEAFEQAAEAVSDAVHDYNANAANDDASRAIKWFLDDMVVSIGFHKRRPTVYLHDNTNFEAVRYFYLDEFFDDELSTPEGFTKDGWEHIAQAFDRLAKRARDNIKDAPSTVDD